MSITAQDIEQEHREALASLTREQRIALERVRAAKQRTHFKGGSIADNLAVMFQDEAQARDAAQEAHFASHPLRRLRAA